MKQVFVSLLLLCSVCLSGTVTGQSDSSLSAADILEIRQLIDTYPRLLDFCVNNGHEYANLFTEDDTFGVAQHWGGPYKIWFRGR